LPEASSEVYAHNTTTRLKAHAFQYYPSGRLEMNLQNPDRERLHISMLDHLGQSMYQESSNLSNYKRSFNLAGMANGKYKLVVFSANSKNKYIRYFEIKPNQQLLPEQTPELLLEVHQNLAKQ
jgi:hypothetical protein